MHLIPPFATLFFHLIHFPSFRWEIHEIPLYSRRQLLPLHPSNKSFYHSIVYYSCVAWKEVREGREREKRVEDRSNTTMTLSLFIPFLGVKEHKHKRRTVNTKE